MSISLLVALSLFSSLGLLFEYLPAALFEKQIDTESPLSLTPCLHAFSHGLEHTLPRTSGKKLSLKFML